MSKSLQQLSRLLITGHVHEHVPMCVLMEIADAHGITYSNKDPEKPKFAHHLLASIHQTNIPTMSEAKTLTEWQYVVRFINKYSPWPQSKLVVAYNFIIEFMNNGDPLSKIPANFIYGLQTPDNPCNVNACVLYKTCVYHRLNTNSRTTIEQMARAVRMLRDETESIIRRAEFFIKRDAKRTDLINILMLSPHEVQDPEPAIIEIAPDYNALPELEISYDLLTRIHQSLTNIQTLQKKIDPTSSDGAVALAAINYNIDISKSMDSIREYRILRINGRDTYQPVDKWMKYWYQKNPTIFDLSVTFNPLFPTQFYNNRQLEAMVTHAGYTNADVSNTESYELLQLAYVAETFYLGEMPNMRSSKTSIDLDDVPDIPYGQLLCFGQMDAPLKPISVSELIDLFNANQNFSSPFHHDAVFTTTAINKLKLILQSPSGPIPSMMLSPETIRIRARLLEVITGIELMSYHGDEPTRQLISSYRNVDPGTKQTIRQALNQLLNAGMYMRGWSGSGAYPVSYAPPNDDVTTAMNVTNAISQYESTLRSLGKLGLQINNLPLVAYKDGQYQVSTDDHNGFTIGDRVAIVKQGKGTGNVASCIRLSSNWICSSTHKYILSLGFPAPFDIFSLREIS
jgi:hypothetical protein